MIRSSRKAWVYFDIENISNLKKLYKSIPKRLPKGKKFDKITQVKGTQIAHIGDSPSGKATDSDSVIRVFESLIPSHKKRHTNTVCLFLCA